MWIVRQLEEFRAGLEQSLSAKREECGQQLEEIGLLKGQLAVSVYSVYF